MIGKILPATNSQMAVYRNRPFRREETPLNGGKNMEMARDDKSSIDNVVDQLESSVDSSIATVRKLKLSVKNLLTKVNGILKSKTPATVIGETTPANLQASSSIHDVKSGKQVSDNGYYAAHGDSDNHMHPTPKNVTNMRLYKQEFEILDTNGLYTAEASGPLTHQPQIQYDFEAEIVMFRYNYRLLDALS